MHIRFSRKWSRTMTRDNTSVLRVAACGKQGLR
jgi:hypothetical protein